MRARLVAPLPGGGRRDPHRARRAGHGPDAPSASRRPDGRPSRPLRGLRARHALAHLRAPDGRDLDRALDRAHAARLARPRRADARPDARRRRGREPRERPAPPAPASARPRGRRRPRRRAGRDPRPLRDASRRPRRAAPPVAGDRDAAPARLSVE